jgi:hypothetical protein
MRVTSYEQIIFFSTLILIYKKIEVVIIVPVSMCKT